MIITIDGPAGAGKSTVARALARRLGFVYLDTGAMYRAVALAGLRRGIDWTSPDALAELAETLSIELVDDRVLLDGEDVSRAIRTQAVTDATRHSADNPRVRSLLVGQQQQLASSRDVVTEGRDQGTVVFPNADCKIFLTARAEERARRRLADVRAHGEAATLQSVLEAQRLRDQRDQSREVGPLVKAPDAIDVPTDGLTVDEVVERLVELVVGRRAGDR